MEVLSKVLPVTLTLAERELHSVEFEVKGRKVPYYLVMLKIVVALLILICARVYIMPAELVIVLRQSLTYMCYHIIPLLC